MRTIEEIESLGLRGNPQCCLHSYTFSFLAGFSHFLLILGRHVSSLTSAKKKVMPKEFLS
jgi:hypothetical protein